MNNFDYCVYIGRFSIFHNAHYMTVKTALQKAKEVIIVIGSALEARRPRNPWTVQERQEMISSSFSNDELSRIKFIHMRDYLYSNNFWVSVLQEKIAIATNRSQNVALIGFESDETSFYLKLFPQFSFIDHPTDFKYHATDVRNYYFSYDTIYETLVPKGVFNFLEKFKLTDDFKNVKSEKDYTDAYKAKWDGSPYPPIFQTVDALVIKSGHVLLVKRGRNPGKGLLAMPGGFLNIKETLVNGCLRELKEETLLKINVPDLKKSIVTSKIFDEPTRSDRGRVFSNTFLIDLGSGSLPQVKGSDDAALAFWMPLSEIMQSPELFFEDHWHIINNMIGKL